MRVFGFYHTKFSRRSAVGHRRECLEFSIAIVTDSPGEQLFVYHGVHAASTTWLCYCTSPPGRDSRPTAHKMTLVFAWACRLPASVLCTSKALRSVLLRTPRDPHFDLQMRMPDAVFGSPCGIVYAQFTHQCTRDQRAVP